MRSAISASLVMVLVQAATAQGLLVPADKVIPPLTTVYHHVNVAIEDQVAVTTVEQAFRNESNRQLEATYVFPVPRGASVNRFTMTVNGADVAGELLDADKARQIYTDIVRRSQDPGLLEYLGTGLMRVRVFPIAPKSDQKITVRFTAISPRDAGIIEYVYPLKTSGPAAQARDFSVKVAIRTQQPLSSIYSPTHAIDIKRRGDREADVTFDRNRAVLNKDFQLFYSVADREIGLTPMTYRPVSSEDGYFLFLINPQFDTSVKPVPRDVVFVLDTSGSMAGIKMDQAKKALRHCLGRLNADDRFAVFNFSSTVGHYRDSLVGASREQIENAQRWVTELHASGGTAINAALSAALALRSNDDARTLTIIFFTDGQPTVGETNPERILKRFADRNSANTRVFTFGVGDDVNAELLDQLAGRSRAESTYVRPAEDIEAKAASLYGKVSHPVLTSLKLTASNHVQLREIYPPELPDLFLGSQIVVLGRYTGQGPAAVKLSGMVGSEPREFVYDVSLPPKGGEDHGFVEHLWARRKVGFLLDQIRTNGENKELVDEVTALAKRYGIATPYTSYLIVPDGPTPLSSQPAAAGGAVFRVIGGKDQSVADFARSSQAMPGMLPQARDAMEDRRIKAEQLSPADAKLAAETEAKKQTLSRARAAFAGGRLADVQTGKLGVDMAVTSQTLRNQVRLTPSAIRTVAGRSLLEVGGVWIDVGYEPSVATVTVKAQSPAYFRLLSRHPELKDLFCLGNYLLWITPNKTALVIDTKEGQEELSDGEIGALFTPKK